MVADTCLMNTWTYRTRTTCLRIACFKQVSRGILKNSHSTPAVNKILLEVCLCSWYKSRWFFLITIFSYLFHLFRIHTWSFLLTGWLLTNSINENQFNQWRSDIDTYIKQYYGKQPPRFVLAGFVTMLKQFRMYWLKPSNRCMKHIIDWIWIPHWL